MKTTTLRKVPGTGQGCGSMGPPHHHYWRIPVPQENKFLADDVTAALAGGCSHQAPCCSIPSQLVASTTPPHTEGRVGRSHGMVSPHPPDSPAKLLGSCKFSCHFLPAPRRILPAQPACFSSHSHDKDPSGSYVPWQASSKRFPGGLPNLNETIAVALIVTRTDTRLKMEASFRITINKLWPSRGWSQTPKLISSKIMTVINNSPKGCCTSKKTPL